jgi:hypothetical protein
MRGTIDDVTDVFVALLTGRRMGMSAVELGVLLRDSMLEKADKPEDVAFLMSQLVGLQTQHLAEALALVDRFAGQPVSDAWITAVVQVSAEKRVTGDPL